MFSVVDLFAGCGGFSKGFEFAGCKVLAAFENWDKAADCYELNFSHPVHRIDLSDTKFAIEIIRALAPDMIIGGPPCQEFSHAGKRVESARANLTESFAEIIEAVKPKFFVMENVDRAQSSKAYSSARKVFVETGYGLTERILLASRCGVPQRRKRFFCIGILNGKENDLDEYLDLRQNTSEMTVREYYGDSWDIDYYYRHPRNYHRRAIFSIDEPAPTIRGVNRPIPQAYKKHPGDASPIDPSIRPLSTHQRALIQTFPARHKFVGTKSDMDLMIGNAVPVELARFVADAIQDYARDKILETAQTSQFKNWLFEQKKLSQRSCGNIISRIRRATNIVPFTQNSIDEYIWSLNNDERFSALSKPIKSQIRRSLKLLDEYIFLENKTKEN